MHTAAEYYKHEKQRLIFWFRFSCFFRQLHLDCSYIYFLSLTFVLPDLDSWEMVFIKGSALWKNYNVTQYYIVFLLNIPHTSLEIRSDLCHIQSIKVIRRIL